MKISVKVKITRSIPKIEVVEGIYNVYINNLPEKNKANLEVVDMLSKYFDVKKNQISIISGMKSKNKIINIV